MDAFALISGVGGFRRAKPAKEEGFKSGSDSDDSVAAGIFVLLWIVLMLAIWITAIVMAARCAQTALNVVVAVLFPLIYLIVRLIVPCTKTIAAAAPPS